MKDRLKLHNLRNQKLKTVFIRTNLEPMKRNLLALFFTIFTIVAWAQAEKKADLASASVAVFPNPATEFITVNNEDAVKNIYVFNLVGRKMKTFEVEKGERYEIGDLPNGLYVVQLIGRNNKVLTSQRLTKKS